MSKSLTFHLGTLIMISTSDCFYCEVIFGFYPHDLLLYNNHMSKILIDQKIKKTA